ncbi:hypothetical protein [Rhizobium sp. S163]|uniref:hypothetical protein n=1 Tax=Rhizobium sp. S163 TaxID=3055039 RepID=UPI0025A9E526|nr:hypothetical protein [Rhizobium sp. S163]MDM9645515.1 hypothetical protein [Rhizobium sp. S163]
MSEDLTTGIVKELIGQLPIKDAYNDAMSSGMKQSGRHFEDIAKTVSDPVVVISASSSFLTCPFLMLATV